MIKLFLENLKINNHPGNNKKILLAVSGGIDSIVMTHLFHLAGYNFALAHCNFQLRGEDSEKDALFVKSLSEKFNSQFFQKNFDTLTYAGDKQLSVQEAARDLRYEWFHELAEENNFDAIAVAQHADDVAETILFNLTRGSGIAGLHGIAVTRGKIIRPLLFATRNEIVSFAKTEKLEWREDVSNAENKYSRNKIRNLVIPVLQELNPSFTTTMLQFSKVMNGYEQIINDFIDRFRKDSVITKDKNTTMSIPLSQLMKSPAPVIVLFHILNKFGFNATVCDNMLNSEKSGATFIVNGYKLVRDRESLILFKTGEANDEELKIEELETTYRLKDGLFKVNKIESQDDFKLLPGFTDASCAFIDPVKLKFPLIIRKWKKGDYFYPLGMTGKKLLSDYFTDEKFSADAKERLYLLISGNAIVWLIGHRIDDRFKINEQSRKAWKFIFAAE